MSRWKLKTIICSICHLPFQTYLLKSGVCPKCQKRKSCKKYYESHKEKFRKDTINWRKNNPEKYKENNHIYYLKNKEKLNKYSKERYRKITKATPRELTRKDFKDWTTTVWKDIKKRADFYFNEQ